MESSKEIVKPVLTALVDLANAMKPQFTGGERFEPIGTFPVWVQALARLQSLVDPNEIPRAYQMVERAAKGQFTLKNIDAFYQDALHMWDMLWKFAKHRIEPEGSKFTQEPFSLTLFTVMLRTRGEWERIRLCSRCERFFVAVPASRRFCSAPCAKQGGAARVHKFLAKKPGYYARAERKDRKDRERRRKIQVWKGKAASRKKEKKS